MERIAQVTCEFTFEASHQLRRDDWTDAENEAVFGNCVRLHGHSYRLVVTVRGAIDERTGMVLNFRDVKQIVDDEVISRLDHRHVNDVMGGLATAENLCYWIGARLASGLGERLYRIELWETRTAFAALGPEDLQGLAAGLGASVIV
jgi:6-pyruvoyltetrahydropterin/6-carboxytetrahydropterin synthase